MKNQNLKKFVFNGKISTRYLIDANSFKNDCCNRIFCKKIFTRTYYLVMLFIFLYTFSVVAAVIYSPGSNNQDAMSPLTDPALNPYIMRDSAPVNNVTADIISQIVVNNDANSVNNNTVEGANITNDVVSNKQNENISQTTTPMQTSNNIATNPTNGPMSQVVANVPSNIVASPVNAPTAFIPKSTISNTMSVLGNGVNVNFTSQDFTEKKVSAKTPSISAPAYILINATTKYIYASKDMNTKYEPAGLANLMTAYIAAKNLSMDTVLTVNRTAVAGVDKDAAIAALDVGDTITLKDAIASMFVKGCVDSANIIAENVSGSIDKFIKLMNDTATTLGLSNTLFVNPSGINNDNQTVSALDMAVIMAAVCENKELVELLSLTEYKLPPAKRREALILYTKNSQLAKANSTYNPDLTCGRLGYNSKARYCVASMAKYKENNLIAIVLKANGTQFSDTRKLIEFGKTACDEDVAN